MQNVMSYCKNAKRLRRIYNEAHSQDKLSQTNSNRSLTSKMHFSTTVWVYISIGSVMAVCFLISLAYFINRKIRESREDRRVSKMSTQDFFPVTQTILAEIPKTSEINRYKYYRSNSDTGHSRETFVEDKASKENPFTEESRLSSYVNRPQPARFSHDSEEEFLEHNAYKV